MLQSSFSNFNLEAFYTNCYSNMLEQPVPLLRTLQSACLMWQFNWIIKMFCVYHVQWLLNKAPDLLFSEYPQSKVHLQKDALQITTEPETPEFLTLQQTLRLSNFILIWSGTPTSNIKDLHKLKKLKIFSFNAIKMCDSTGTKPFS